MASLLDTLKGPNGTFEVARVLFAGGGVSMVTSPVVFQAIALWHGQHFDAMSFCAGYGGGLAGVLSLGGLGIATKDKGVATAKATCTDADKKDGGD